MGDGIMALFGAPIAHEDHAVRACYAALAMQEAIRRYSEEVRRGHGVEVQIRVGLNSGAARRKPPERDQVGDDYRQSLALAEELGMRPLVAHCHLALGTLSATIGRRAEARTELFTAIDLYRAMDMTFWLPQAEAALAQLEAR
jgi:sugar phosphate isomerase/epimerase